MATHTVNADDNGAYELPIPADTITTITVDRDDIGWETLQVVSHTGDEPVYVRMGDTVTVRDPAAWMVAPGGYLDLEPTFRGPATVSLTTAADAIVSVIRQPR